MKLGKYFNQQCFEGSGPGLTSIFGAVSAGMLLSSSSTPLIILGVVTSAYTAGQVNMWQRAVTGKPIWEPKLGIFGI